jgi:hypothetical protein
MQTYKLINPDSSWGFPYILRSNQLILCISDPAAVSIERESDESKQVIVEDYEAIDLDVNAIEHAVHSKLFTLIEGFVSDEPWWSFQVCSGDSENRYHASLVMGQGKKRYREIFLNEKALPFEINCDQELEEATHSLCNKITEISPELASVFVLIRSEIKSFLTRDLLLERKVKKINH